MSTRMNLGNSFPLTTLFHLVTVITMVAGTSYRCESLTIPMCQGLGYESVMMPNAFDQDSQDEAGLEVHQFWPLIEIQCSPYLKEFLCSLYAPECVEPDEGPSALLPCRTLCQQARDGCAPLMVQYGFSWPDRLNCDNLPLPGNGVTCVGENNPVSPAIQCETMAIPVCNDMPYTSVMFPNLLGHNTQQEANLEVHQFFPLIKVECSAMLKPFLCMLYAPECNPSGRPEPPCREMCQEARDGCEPLMNKFGFQWPQSLNCENFSPCHNEAGTGWEQGSNEQYVSQEQPDEGEVEPESESEEEQEGSDEGHEEPDEEQEEPDEWLPPVHEESVVQLSNCYLLYQDCLSTRCTRVSERCYVACMLSYLECRLMSAH